MRQGNPDPLSVLGMGCHDREKRANWRFHGLLDGGIWVAVADQDDDPALPLLRLNYERCDTLGTKVRIDRHGVDTPWRIRGKVGVCVGACCLRDVSTLGVKEDEQASGTGIPDDPCQHPPPVLDKALE